MDWNCDGDATDLNIAQDLNKDGDLDYLDGSLDWGRLIYNGGSIGLPGVIREPVHTTYDAHEMTLEDYQALHQQAIRVTGGVDVPTTPVPVGRTVTATAAYTGPAGAPVTWSWVTARPARAPAWPGRRAGWRAVSTRTRPRGSTR